jgi:ribosomal protein L35AE/L33A
MALVGRLLCAWFGHRLDGRVLRVLYGNGTVRARFCSRCSGWIAGGRG